MQAILDAHEGILVLPTTDEDLLEAAEPLPPPMIPDNWESSADKCFIGPSFKNVIMGDASGWEYKDEVWRVWVINTRIL